MATTDFIRYDILVQQALRNVVKKVLKDAAQEGLPGGHHFYISFKTSAPQVKLSRRLKEMYQDEMTIVIEHQYWDLHVTEDFFEIGLSFDKIPEKLSIPFFAITGFFDPSVKFGLKFEIEEKEKKLFENDDKKEEALPALKKEKAKSEVISSQKTNPILSEKPAEEEKSQPTKKRSKKDKKADDSATIISLDSFRKKK